MTDQFDRASEIEEDQREDALQAQARRAGLAGVQTCIECQRFNERYGHPGRGEE